MLVAEAWTPVSARDRVQDALRRVSDSSSATVRPEPCSEPSALAQS